MESSKNNFTVDFYERSDLAGFAGQLALCNGSFGKDIRQSLDDLHQNFSVDVMVVVSTERELEEVGAPYLVNMAADAGLETMFYRLQTNRKVPSMTEFSEVIESILDRLEGGETVCIYSKGGYGRSALLATCVLVAAGRRFNIATDATLSLRPKAYRSPWQTWNARSFHRFWKKKMMVEWHQHQKFVHDERMNTRKKYLTRLSYNWGAGGLRTTSVVQPSNLDWHSSNKLVL